MIIGGEKDNNSKSARATQPSPTSASRFVYTLNELWPLLLHDDMIEVGEKGK